MVFNVRCYKCGEQDVRLILGGRAIIHARCHSCDSNLLAEVMELEQQVEAQRQASETTEEHGREEVPTESFPAPPTSQSDDEAVV